MKRCNYFGLISLCLIVVLLNVTGCYSDKEELLYPDSFNCDTAAVKYSTTILPIISNSCYGCHAGSFPSGSIKLDTYDDIRVHALNGRLYGAVSHSSGFKPMPENESMLSECKIKAIKKWIDQGAPNN